jgi:flagellar hook-associated protein 3 FlgL
MSASISLASGDYGSFGGNVSGTVLTDSANIKQQLDTLTEQAGSGLVADTYAGLGSGISTALALQPVLADQTTWQNNISAASGQMGVAQNALSQISSIASNFYAQVDNLNGLDASEVDSVASDAQSALQQVANLLDEQDGTVYVFAGQDSADPPVPSPDDILNSGFYTQIQQAVQGLATNGGAATTAATLTIAASNAVGTSPFSATLSQPTGTVNTLLPTISTGPGEQATVGILASANAFVGSTGVPATSTGSYTRDILCGLATLASLSSSQINDAGFSTVVQNVGLSLGNAITALNQDAGVLGDQQTALQTQSTGIADSATALQTQLGGAQDVDMASTLSQLTQTETQLEASYDLIAGLQSATLLKYLPVGT